MRRRSEPVQVIGDQLCGAAAIAERQTNAAAGQRRDVTGGIADEKNIGRSRRPDRSADRNKPASPLDDLSAREAEEMVGMADKLRKIGLDITVGRKSSLEQAGCGRDPGEVAAGVFGIEEAVKKIGIGLGQFSIFAFEADEESPVAAEREETRNRRAGAVGADDEARTCIEFRKEDELSLPLGA